MENRQPTTTEMNANLNEDLVDIYKKVLDKILNSIPKEFLISYLQKRKIIRRRWDGDKEKFSGRELSDKGLRKTKPLLERK